MIIKSKDDTRAAVAALQQLLAVKTLSKKRREALEKELVRVRPAAEGEKEAAGHIDFHLKDSKNWAVIHDLRIEHGGRVAQIDHLLIGRFFDIFVIESKNFTAPLRLDSHGDFQVRTDFGWEGMPSPIEQNRRHIIALNQLIGAQKLTPMRMGLPIKPAYRNWILVPPECYISPRHIEEAIILKMDMFDRHLHEFMSHSSLTDDVLSVAKICSTGTIMDFARKLVTFHRPASPVPPPLPAVVACDRCGVEVGAKVAAYCRFHSRKFGRRILCGPCQVCVPAARRILPHARRGVKTPGEGARSRAR
jgi:hypothetical protein